MNTKLTLTLNKEVIEEAKKYASKRGRSLSEMVENYFKFLTEKKPEQSEEIKSSKVRKLRGIIKVHSDFDYKKILEEEKVKKHGA